MNEPSTLQVVLMGLITVFFVLVCLIGIIKLMGLIMVKLTERKAASSAVPAAAPAAAPAVPQADKQKLVAAIATAIAEEMGTDVDHLRIHSIRKL